MGSRFWLFSALYIYLFDKKKKNPRNECANYPPLTSYLFNLCRKAHIWLIKEINLDNSISCLLWLYCYTIVSTVGLGLLFCDHYQDRSKLSHFTFKLSFFIGSTITVMTSLVALSFYGASQLKFHWVERYDKLLVGSVLCMVGILTLMFHDHNHEGHGGFSGEHLNRKIIGLWVTFLFPWYDALNVLYLHMYLYCFLVLAKRCLFFESQRNSKCTVVKSSHNILAWNTLLENINSSFYLHV